MGANGTNFVGATDLSDINYSRQFGGTSSATAQVTGVVSLLLKEAYYLSADTIIDIIKRTAIDMGPVGFDSIFGHGRINAFDALQLANDSVLPVLWVEQLARVNEKNVTLYMKAQQSAGSHFELLRNGEKIARLPINVTDQYEYWDLTPGVGTFTYQFVWVGTDGQRWTSPKVQARIDAAFDLLLKNTSEKLILEGSGMENGRLQLELWDMGSRLLKKKNLMVVDGNIKWEVALEELSKGLYVIQLVDALGRRKRLKWLR